MDKFSYSKVTETGGTLFIINTCIRSRRSIQYVYPGILSIYTVTESFENFTSIYAGHMLNFQVNESHNYWTRDINCINPQIRVIVCKNVVKNETEIPRNNLVNRLYTIFQT